MRNRYLDYQRNIIVLFGKERLQASSMVVDIILYGLKNDSHSVHHIIIISPWLVFNIISQRQYDFR